jgi:hypothetical protein
MRAGAKKLRERTQSEFVRVLRACELEPKNCANEPKVNLCRFCGHASWSKKNGANEPKVN